MILFSFLLKKSSSGQMSVSSAMWLVGSRCLVARGRRCVRGVRGGRAGGFCVREFIVREHGRVGLGGRVGNAIHCEGLSVMPTGPRWGTNSSWHDSHTWDSHKHTKFNSWHTNIWNSRSLHPACSVRLLFTDRHAFGRRCYPKGSTRLTGNVLQRAQKLSCSYIKIAFCQENVA